MCHTKSDLQKNVTDNRVVGHTQGKAVNTTQTERCKFSRAPLDAEVYLISDNEEVLTAVGKDIGEGGLLVSVDSRLTVDCHVETIFMLFGEMHSARGTVRWATEGQDTDPEVGIQFSFLKPQTKETIQRWIEHRRSRPGSETGLPVVSEASDDVASVVGKSDAEAVEHKMRSLAYGYQIVETENTEYHMKKSRCVGVKPRGKARWHERHPIVGLELRGCLLSKRETFSQPYAGGFLWFVSKSKKNRFSSKIQSIRLPSDEELKESLLRLRLNGSFKVMARTKARPSPAPDPAPPAKPSSGERLCSIVAEAKAPTCEATHNALVASDGSGSGSGDRQAAHLAQPMALEVALAPTRGEVLLKYLTLKEANHFQLLGVSTDATVEEIVHVAAGLLLVFDPGNYGYDTTAGEPAEADFRLKVGELRERVARARDVLISPERREAYLKDLGPMHDKPTGKANKRGDAAGAAFEAGKRQLQAKEYAAAIKSFRLAHHGDPAQATYLAYLGWALFSAHPEKNAKSAKEYLQLAVVCEPELVEAYLFLGQIAKAERRPDYARTQFEKALELNPNSTRAMKEVASLVRHQG